MLTIFYQTQELIVLFDPFDQKKKKLKWLGILEIENVILPTQKVLFLSYYILSSSVFSFGFYFVMNKYSLQTETN